MILISVILRLKMLFDFEKRVWELNYVTLLKWKYFQCFSINSWYLLFWDEKENQHTVTYEDSRGAKLGSTSPTLYVLIEQMSQSTTTQTIVQQLHTKLPMEIGAYILVRDENTVFYSSPFAYTWIGWSIKKFTPSLGISHLGVMTPTSELGVKFGNHLSLLSLGS